MDNEGGPEDTSGGGMSELASQCQQPPGLSMIQGSLLFQGDGQNV